MTKSHHQFFNPTFNNVLTGLIIYYVKGEDTKKKLAQHRLDIIEGNIARYSRCLNSSRIIEAMNDHLELAAAVAAIST